MSALATFIEQLPKAELHLHLEGAVPPALFGRFAFGLSAATFAEIAANGLSHCWSPAIAQDPPRSAPALEPSP